jgi:hypothetical protein
MSVYIVSELRAANNADVPLLPWLLLEVPHQLMISDQWQNSVSLLSELMTGPFCVTEEDSHFVLQSHCVKSGRPIRLRITSTPWFPNAVQYCNDDYVKWDDCPPTASPLVAT